MKSLEERVEHLEGGFRQIFKALNHQAEFNKQIRGLLDDLVKLLGEDMERQKKMLELLEDE